MVWSKKSQELVGRLGSALICLGHTSREEMSINIAEFHGKLYKIPKLTKLKIKLLIPNENIDNKVAITVKRLGIAILLIR